MMICNSSLQMHSLLGSKSCTAYIKVSDTAAATSAQLSTAQHAAAVKAEADMRHKLTDLQSQLTDSTQQVTSHKSKAGCSTNKGC